MVLTWDSVCDANFPFVSPFLASVAFSFPHSNFLRRSRASLLTHLSRYSLKYFWFFKTVFRAHNAIWSQCPHIFVWLVVGFPSQCVKWQLIFLLGWQSTPKPNMRSWHTLSKPLSVSVAVSKKYGGKKERSRVSHSQFAVIVLSCRRLTKDL